MLPYLGASLLLLGLSVYQCAADTPANCTLEDVLGEWNIYEGQISKDPNLDCSQVPNVVRKIQVTFKEDYAIENNWSRGTWTMVYNQGFEAILSFRTYFAFFQWEKNGNEVTSFCNLTLTGKSHDVTLRNYACFFGRKKDNAAPRKVHKLPYEGHALLSSGDKSPREMHERLVERINTLQTSWRAQVHEPFVHLTFREHLRTFGGTKSWLPAKPKALHSPKFEVEDNFDWRDINGTNFVSPVRNQGECGSCYAFSSVGMMESRLRVYTNRRQQPVLSPQDIVSCTKLSQGCDGGFPFLIAGRYGWETGLVEESCNPYAGVNELCPREDCQRWYTAKYSYVGGRYGACSELEMIRALGNGPISVSFDVYPDFMHYKSGIYHRTGVTSRFFKDFEPVNHAVLLVGYGLDSKTGEKFWIVKNSWGEEWGEKGYFRIRRGVDEVGIESIAVEAFPIPV